MRQAAAASLHRRLPVVASGHGSVPVMKGRWLVVRVVGVVQVLGAVLVLRLAVVDNLVVVAWSVGHGRPAGHLLVSVQTVVVVQMAAVGQAALRMAVGMSMWARGRDRASRLLICS